MMFNFWRANIVFSIVIFFSVADANAKERKSEANESIAPGHRVNGYENNASQNTLHLHKRQINSQLPPFLPQDFPEPFISDQPDSNGPIRQFPGQVTLDDEERFFSNGNQPETTLNPLAFINPPRTTPSPAEQQVINQQRQFQEEIANRGLREQQLRSFGVPQPPTTRRTTTTTTTTSTISPFESFVFPPNPSDSFTDTELGLAGVVPEDQTTDNSLPADSLPPSPQSYAYSRIFRSSDRRARSIDRQQSSVNVVPSSTPTSQSFVDDLLLQHSTPQNDLATIGNWLIRHFAQQLQQNIAQLAESTAKPYTARAFKSSPSPSSTTSSTLYNHRPRNVDRPRHHHPHPDQRPTVETASWDGRLLYATESPTSSPTFVGLADASSTTIRAPPHIRTPAPVNVRPLHSHYQSVSDTSRSRHELINAPRILSTTDSVPVGGLTFQHSPTVSYVVQPATPDVTPTPPIVYHLPYAVPSSTTAPSSLQNHFAKASKVKNVQILTSSTLEPVNDVMAIAPTTPPNNDAAGIFQAYRQIFAADHQPAAAYRPLEIATLQSVTNQPTAHYADDTTSVTTLFKTKLNEFKTFNPRQLSRTQDVVPSTFQQQDQFLDQLQQHHHHHHQHQQQQPNTSVNQFPATSSANPIAGVGENGDVGGARTAIFIKMPAEQPTSTVGYLFDKTIGAKTLHKKQSSPPKKNNRSAQVITSSLVYRTPPGKRATVSQLEQSKSNQLDAAALSNVLEAGKPLKWLLGNGAAPSTTTRPFVNALLNFIQKRSPQ